MVEVDEEYVAAILKQLPSMKITREQFLYYTRLDRNGGWQDEVEEAARRYFKDSE